MGKAISDKHPNHNSERLLLPAHVLLALCSHLLPSGLYLNSLFGIHYCYKITLGQVNDYTCHSQNPIALRPKGLEFVTNE
jgi:hypothetical protein